MKVNVIILFLALVVTGSYAQENKLEEIPQLEEKIDLLVKAYEKLDIFSGVVLVAQKGNPFYHKAFGLANRNSGQKNTLTTTFDIGSMNKSFTKVALLKLIAEEKIGLDDPIGKYLQGFKPEIAKKVKVEHLIMHTSGFGDYHSPAYFDLAKEKKTIQYLVEQFKQQDLMFEPGTEQEYSNAGYILLGAIMEKVTGKSYFEVIQTLIIDHLGLQNTYVNGKEAAPNRAIGYLKTMKGELEDNDDVQDPPNPDGGFYATAADILKFYQAFHYGEALWTEKVKALDPLYTAMQKYKNTGAAIPHAGGFNGANTACFEILRDQISVVVFANMDEPVAENLAAGILAIIRGKEPKEPVLPAVQQVYKALKEKGKDYVKANFDQLITNFHPTDPRDIILNDIGYTLLFSGDSEELNLAITAFQLNTELFPDVPNVWDSLGEAYRKKGDIKQSRKAYHKALMLDPEMETAKQALAEMKH